MAGDPYWDKVRLLMHGGDFRDVITSVDATNDGAVATIDTGVYRFGTGSIKTGASPLWFPNSADWDFGTGPFCIEFWVRFTDVSGIKTLLSHYGWGQNVPSWMIELYNGNMRLSYLDGIGTQHNLISSGVTYAVNSWYAVCVERDSNGVAWLFINGVRRGKASNYNWTFSGMGQPLAIGTARPTIVNRDALAYFDEIRITKGFARYARDYGYAVQTDEFPEFLQPSTFGSLDQNLGTVTLDAYDTLPAPPPPPASTRRAGAALFIGA